MAFALNRSGVVASSLASRSVSDGAAPEKVPSSFQVYIDDYHEYGPDLDAHARKFYMHLRNKGRDRTANLFMSSYEGLETGFFTAVQIGPALVKTIVGVGKQENQSGGEEGVAERMVGGVFETVSGIPGAILGAYHSIADAADLSPKEFSRGFAPVVTSGISVIGMAHMLKSAKGLLTSQGSKLLPNFLKSLA